MGVLHGEDSHNQSSGRFKDKLRSWRGVGAASAAEQPARIFVPERHSVPSLEDCPREVCCLCFGAWLASW